MKKSILFSALVSLLFVSCSNNDEMTSSAQATTEYNATATIQQLEKINANLKQNKMSATMSGDLAFTDDEEEFKQVGDVFTRVMGSVMEADKEKSLNKDNIDKEIADRIDASSGGLSPLEREIVNSEEFQSDFDFDDSDNSPSHMIAKLYLEAIKSFGESVTEQDVVNVTNQYIAVVRNSTELSDDDKTVLYVTLSIGNSAFKFWSKFLS